MSEIAGRTPETYGSGDRAESATHAYFLAISRACGGALFFALPLLLTMEMWWLGFHMDWFRLGLLMVVLFVVLVSLAREFRWHGERTWGHAVRQATTAYAVALTMSAVILGMLGVLRPPF